MVVVVEVGYPLPGAAASGAANSPPYGLTAVLSAPENSPICVLVVQGPGEHKEELGIEASVDSSKVSDDDTFSIVSAVDLPKEEMAHLLSHRKTMKVGGGLPITQAVTLDEDWVEMEDPDEERNLDEMSKATVLGVFAIETLSPFIFVPPARDIPEDEDKVSVVVTQRTKKAKRPSKGIQQRGLALLATITNVTAPAAKSAKDYLNNTNAVAPAVETAKDYLQNSHAVVPAVESTKSKYKYFYKPNVISPAVQYASNYFYNTKRGYHDKYAERARAARANATENKGKENVSIKNKATWDEDTDWCSL